MPVIHNGGGGQGEEAYMSSLHNRLTSHQTLQTSKNMSGPMSRHDRDFHDGECQSYTTEEVARERKLLSLYTTEALWIERQRRGTSMNERNEAGRGGIVD